eukprot:scaffold3941_cov412-Prasinococcus_capsulatus_cf.AAC.15
MNAMLCEAEKDGRTIPQRCSCPSTATPGRVPTASKANQEELLTIRLRADPRSACNLSVDRKP